MAISNKERVGRAIEHLRQGLRPYVEQEMRAAYGSDWISAYATETDSKGEPSFDTQALLKAMIDCWDTAFGRRLKRDVFSLAHDARKTRNRYAHEEPFETDDAYTALHGIQKLLEAINAPQSEEVEKLKVDLLRQRFEEQARREHRRASTLATEGTVLGGLKPWRDIVAPHEDVARGTYQQAEFAADLWQVYKGEGSDEYRNPADFFERTYLTEGLRELLTNALKRLTGAGGDPVVELQINFGGGKTHSMLSLYHLFSGVKATELPGIEGILAESGVPQPPAVRRAVLVGNALTPGSPSRKEDGTVVNTLWGEMAWQLGGREGYEIVRQADETATNPGDALDQIFRRFGPCLVLIDEWVAYARQLYGRERMLPAGSFDTQFTFAQTLCEAARRSPCALVLVSIPASISEQGDLGGQSALDSLKQAVGRSNLVWRPASTDESFEIVRRRLFQAVTDPRHRDAVVKAFMDMYRANPQEFPAECRESDYERRMKAAYPIHPDLFDRLYNDWSTLEKFQKTRGVLRLMAAAIHTLWQREDKSVLILPATVPIDDPNVQTEFTRYLEERWGGVIDKDVDGPHSEPLKLDGENVNFGRYSACRRAARAVFLGSAPTLHAAAQGIEDKRIKLGCAQPGESIPTFGDALWKLSDRTTYLYVNGTRYWYSTQASVNKIAAEMAEREEIKQKVESEIVRRLKLNTRNRGEFHGVHVALPSADIPDDRNLRLVVLGPGFPHKQGAASSPAVEEAADTLRYHGTAHRNYRNMLVFAACDQTRLPELDQATRLFLAWTYVVEHNRDLDLTPNNLSQAETKARQFDAAIEQKIGEVYQWVLAPTQPPAGSDPDVIARWEEFKAQGADPLAVRAAKKLKTEQVLTDELGGNVLRHEIEQVPLWRGDHVSVSQLEDDFSRYLYLSRLLNVGILHAGIRDAVARVVDGLYYADRHDEDTGAYEGLRSGVLLEASRPLTGLLVKPDAAAAYLEEQDRKRAAEAAVVSGNGAVDDRSTGGYTYTTTGAKNRTVADPPVTAARAKPKRFHGSVSLDPNTISTGAGKVSQEVVQHLLKLLASHVEVTLEIHASNPEGFPDHVVRTIMENCRVLGFGDQYGFEEE